MPYSALKLSDKSRDMVLSRFPALFGNVKADHVTVFFPTRVMPSQPRKCLIVGTMPITLGVQVLAVKVNGSKFREDGNLFHLTVSHAVGAKPVLANKIMSDHKIAWFKEPIALEVTPVIVETT